MGGALVGFVDSVQPERAPSGQPIAVLGLKLNKSIGKLPVNSTFAIRLKGAIGQKYLAIGLGSSRRTYADGATVPLAPDERRRRPRPGAVDVQLRRRGQGVVASTVGFSDGLAGRGVGHQRRDRGVPPAARGPGAGGAQPRLVRAPTWAGSCTDSRRSRARSRRWRTRRRRCSSSLDGTFRALASVSIAVPSGRDLRHAAGVQRGDRRQPDDPAVPDRHRGAVQRAASGDRDAAGERAGARRRVHRRAYATFPGPRRSTSVWSSLSNALATLRADAGRAGRARSPDADRLEPSLAARVPDAGPGVVQLRDAVPAQRREHAVREHDARARRCGSRWSRSTTSSAGKRSRRTTRTRRHRRTRPSSTGRSTSTRIRTPTRPARPPSARPGTSRTRARRRTSATSPGNQGLQTEQTGQTGQAATRNARTSGGQK